MAFSVEVCSTEEHLLFEVAYVRGLSRSRKESGSPTTPQLPGPGLERKTEPFFGAVRQRIDPYKCIFVSLNMFVSHGQFALAIFVFHTEEALPPEKTMDPEQGFHHFLKEHVDKSHLTAESYIGGQPSGSFTSFGLG